MSTSGEISDIEAILMGGQSLRIRLIGEDDKERLQEFFYRLSPRTRYLRFHHTKSSVSDKELAYFTEVELPGRCAYVATMGDENQERIVALGRWDVLPEDSRSAEVAFVVEDNIQVR